MLSTGLRRTSIGCFSFILLAAVAPLQAETPVDWPKEIRTLADSGHLEQAVRMTDEWIRNYPDDLDAKAWHARILSWMERWGEAEAEFRDLVQLNPNDPDLLMGLAHLSNFRNHYEEALGLLDRACSLSSERADCRLEQARTLTLLGRKTEARALYRTLVDVESVSEASRVALAELREQGRHQFRLGGNLDLISYAGDGGALVATFDSTWSARWRTVTTLTRYLRFGKSATGVEADATYRLSGSDAITIGAGSAPGEAIAPRAKAQLAYDHGIRFSAGPVRGVEVLFDQKWVRYPGVKALNFAPGGIVQLPKGWNCLFRLSLARIASTGAEPTWRPTVQSRVMFPVRRRFTGQLLYATGSENFGTVDQILLRASRIAGAGLTIHVSPGQEFTVITQYQAIARGRSLMGFGGTYAIHF